jgi:hypothetical protein
MKLGFSEEHVGNATTVTIRGLVVSYQPESLM